MSNVCNSPLGRLVDWSIQQTSRWTRPLVKDADIPDIMVPSFCRSINCLKPNHLVFHCSYSNATSRPPSAASFHIRATPPWSSVPLMMTAAKPASMMTNCTASVQITAFRPPCNTFTFTFRAFSRRFYPKRLTISTFVIRSETIFCCWYSKDVHRTKCKH